ncbi:MAG: hypothetical protein E7543_08305 [Ruminococcaceae bacterium]|nr:hypothetical protein [Oscillospiraceae bacterium]MBQ9914436.1 hypothetical protein [Clostridia bacterium]
MKTRKLLSVLMAVMMLFGCLSVSASALEINLPAELGEGVVKFRGLATVSSAEIPVAAEYTELAADAVFTVYYSAEKEENILDVLAREEKGTIGSGDAYLKDGVLHLNLKGLGLEAEGYYYITVGGGALKYEGRYNATTTTEGVLYQFESLAIGDKLASIFDFIAGIIINLIGNGKTY